MIDFYTFYTVHLMRTIENPFYLIEKKNIRKYSAFLNKDIY